MAFPRLTALAEAVWTPLSRKDYADYRARLETHLRRLTVLDVNFRKPEPYTNPAGSESAVPRPPRESDVSLGSSGRDRPRD